MKIEKSDKKIKLEELQKKKEFLPSILNEIFVICKEDKTFSTSVDSTKELDSKIKILENKLNRQNELLTKSGDLKSNILKKIELIDTDIFKLRVKLLEQLGSEI